MFCNGMDTQNDTLVRLPTASVPWQAGRTIFSLILREMGTTYGRSPGGYIWAILEPIGMIVILALAFSLIVRSPSLGSSFILFYATGFLPFQLYNNVSTKTATAINFSRALLAYPSVTWLDAVLGRFVLEVLTSTTVFCILITAILLVINSHVILDFTPIVVGITLAAMIGLGVGMINCLLFSIFPVWKSIWGIVTRPLIIASGVLFTLEDMPPTVQDILWWNPLIHITGLVRTGFYSTYHASYVSLLYTFAVALILICAGLLFLRANYKTVLEK
jgi:capsular polysaccharide transport system permease protein